MHSIYEKELSLIFLFLCTCWSRHSIVLHNHADGSQSVAYGGAHSSFPDSRCSCFFFHRALWELHKSLDVWRLQLQAAAFIRTFRTALHDTKAVTQAQSRKGRPVPAAFVPFHNNWDSWNSIHTNSFLYFALSPPVSCKNPIHSEMSSLIMQWLSTYNELTEERPRLLRLNRHVKYLQTIFCTKTIHTDFQAGFATQWNSLTTLIDCIHFKQLQKTPKIKKD